MKSFIYILLLMGMLIPAFAIDECGSPRDTDTFSTADTSYDRWRNDSDWNVGPNADSMTRDFYFQVAEPGIVTIELYSIDKNQADFSYSDSSCPPASGGSKSRTEVFTSAGDFNIKVYYLTTDSNTNIEYGLRITFTPSPTDLELTGNVDLTDVKVGTDATFSLTATNNSTKDADPNITLTTTYSLDVNITSITAAGYTCSPTTGSLSKGNPITCTSGTAIANGATNDFTFVIMPTEAGTLTQTAVIDSTTAEATPADNTLTLDTNAYGNADAVNDIVTTEIDTVVNFNVLDNDTGLNNQVIALVTTPSDGTLSALDPNGDFTYTPDTGFAGNVTFQYTIRDADGNEDTAEVSISVFPVTDYSTAFEFNLINPDYTRNIRGNYKIAGNTVLCLTTETDGYAENSSCVDQNTGLSSAATSNNYVAKFIDIDGDPDTWNSSSSYITLPTTYDQQGGKGILWAGLFWQGRYAYDSSVQDLHYGEMNASGSGYHFVETGDGTGVTSVSLADGGAENIQLKLNTGAYAPVKANKIYSLESSDGLTFAAYSDVTSYLQNANLGKGDQTITVANLPTSEGRENSPGILGGWSIVVIYGEDLNGEPRNISVYNGFDSVGSSNPSIEITGFKLPSSGDISANLSVFAGEGEKPYADDWIKLSADDSTFDYMPGASDQDNTFDGIMDGITRADVTGHFNNLQYNNVGVEVDNYTLDTLISTYPRDIKSMYIKWWSENDYIIPSMMVFSTELYQPTVCYDYTYDFDGYVIPSTDLDLDTTFQNLDVNLTTHLTVRSTEGDFDLTDVRVTVNSDAKYLAYVDGTAAYAGNQINAYTPMFPPELNVTADNNFIMHIGDGAGLTGGTLHPYETHFMRFQHDLNNSQSTFSTRLNITLDYFTDYGSGLVPIHTKLTQSDRCTGYTSYQPEWGSFNIIDGAQTNINTYNLKTQVASRPFSAKAVGYGGPTFTSAQTYNTAIEIEVFNVGIFGTDTNVSCLNPDNAITEARFYTFNGTSQVPMDNLTYDRANQNSAFRVWYLEDRSGALVNHKPSSTLPGDPVDEGLYDTIYAASYAGDGNCTTPCSNLVGGCYSCLHKYYARPLCSRDNYSIRPESFNITMTDPAGTPVGDNLDSEAKKVVGGYKYQIDLSATLFGSETPVKGYVYSFAQKDADDYIIDEDLDNNASMINTFKTNANCNDINHEGFAFNFWDGASSNPEIVVRNVGEYKFHVLDTNWTFVDNPGTYGYDCTANSSSATGIAGCNISSVADGHFDLNLRSYPYTFDMSGVVMSSPALADKYMYSNQLNVQPDTNDEMALSFKGYVQAQGKDMTAMTNFTSGCYSQSLSLSIDQNMSGEDSLGNTWSDNNGSLAEGNPIRWRELNASLANGTHTLPLGRTEVLGSFPDVNLTKTEFSKSLNGATNLQLLLNIDRDVTTPHNPMQLSLNSLKVRCEGTSCDSIADGAVDYTPEGVYTNTDAVINIFYARAHTPRYRVGGNSVAGLRSYYEVYCVNCNLPRLQTVSLPAAANPLLSVDDTRWYQNTIHTSDVGDIPATNAMSTQNPTQAARFTQIGANRATTAVTTSDFTYDGQSGYPYKATITYIPDPWLIYNRFDNTATLNTFELEFFNAGSWGGNDNTGGTNANTNSSVNTNRRIQW